MPNKKVENKKKSRNAFSFLKQAALYVTCNYFDKIKMNRKRGTEGEDIFFRMQTEYKGKRGGKSIQ